MSRMKGEKVNEKKIYKTLGGCGKLHFSKFLSRSEVLRQQFKLVPNGVLIVLCTMKKTTSAESVVWKKEICNEASNGKKWKMEEENDVESLCRGYKEVLLDGSNPDLILKVGDREFRAHRDILKAQSRVFEFMLSHDMDEKRSGIIDIPDCDPESIEQFLSCAYCGKVERLDHHNMFQLYYIADKYEIEGLKEECQSFIEESLSPTNICEVMQLAVNHNDSSLLDEATEYFMDNAVDIFQTEEWQSFMRDNFAVANDLLIKSYTMLKHKIDD